MAVPGHTLLVCMHSVVENCSDQFKEVAFVGKAPGSYLMLLGGGYYGQRLNKIYRGNLDFLLRGLN
jgi:sulfite reductase (NADPH) hemoprotein beta-component